MTASLSRLLRPGWAGLVITVALLGVLFWGLLGTYDLQTFLQAGRQVVEGRSPYVDPSAPVFRAGHAFVYPAFVAWVFAPLALLPGSLAVALYAAGSVVAIVLSCRWFGRPGPWPAALLLVSSTTVIALQMGTVNPFLLLGLASAWRLRSKRPVLSGVILGLVAAVKLFLTPLLIWPFLRRRYSATAASVGTFVAALATETTLGRIRAHRYLDLLDHLQNSEAVRSWSLSSFLQSLGLASSPAGDLVVVVGAIAVVALWANRRRISDAQTLGLTVIVCLALSPIVWSSYLLLASAPLLLLGHSPRALVAAALVSWALVTPDASSTVRDAGGIGLMLVVCWMAVRAERPLAAPGPGVVGRVGWRPVLVCGGAGAVLIAVPPQVRNALPALMALSAVAAWTWTRKHAVGVFRHL